VALPDIGRQTRKSRYDTRNRPRPLRGVTMVPETREPMIKRTARPRNGSGEEAIHHSGFFPAKISPTQPHHRHCRSNEAVYITWINTEGVYKVNVDGGNIYMGGRAQTARDMLEGIY